MQLGKIFNGFKLPVKRLCFRCKIDWILWYCFSIIHRHTVIRQDCKDVKAGKFLKAVQNKFNRKVHKQFGVIFQLLLTVGYSSKMQEIFIFPLDTPHMLAKSFKRPQIASAAKGNFGPMIKYFLWVPISLSSLHGHV